MTMMIVYCNSFQDAQDAFSIFMDYLETYEPFSITNVFEYSYCVETDYDFRYIFVDYRMVGIFSDLGMETVEIFVDEFIDSIDMCF